MSTVSGPRSGWPTQWFDLDEQPEGRQEQMMVSVARDVAGPHLDLLLAAGVVHATTRHPVPMGVEIGVRGDHLPDVLSHLDAGDHPMVHRRAAGDGEIRLWARKDRRAAQSTWSDHCRRLQERATAMAHLVRRLAAQVAGDLAVTDEDGVVLTGAAALAERRRIYASELCAEWTRAHHVGNLADWLLSHTADDTAEGALAPDLRTAQQQLLERLDDAARGHIAYLLDAEDPAYARATGTEQTSALRLLDIRRQEGRLDIRAAASVATALTAATAAIRRCTEVSVEHAPSWRGSAGSLLTLAAGVLTTTWTPPASGRWSYALTVIRTDQRRTILMPDVVLDLPDLPAGWDVAIGSRHAALPRWPVTLTAPASPSPGVYDIALVARDDIGPSRLKVRVTVPERTSGAK